MPISVLASSSVQAIWSWAMVVTVVPLNAAEVLAREQAEK